MLPLPRELPASWLQLRSNCLPAGTAGGIQAVAVHLGLVRGWWERQGMNSLAEEGARRGTLALSFPGIHLGWSLVVRSDDVLCAFWWVRALSGCRSAPPSASQGVSSNTETE